MGKIVFWLVVVFAILFVLRLINSAKVRRRHADGTRTGPSRADDMVRCVSCATYVPRAEAKPGPAGLTCGERKCLSR